MDFDDTIRGDINKLFFWFNSCVEKREFGCHEIFCGTCGGVYREIDSSMTHDKRVLLASILQRATIDQLEFFGSYRVVIRRLDPYRYRMPYIRAILDVDRSDPREIDRAIYKAGRGLSLNVPAYSELIDHAVHIAISKRDISLTETLILRLGFESLEFPELIDFAKQVSIDDFQMQRVLYNCFREKLPEVRSFVGDGTTQVPNYYLY
jgi:hypothetical protein